MKPQLAFFCIYAILCAAHALFFTFRGFPLLSALQEMPALYLMYFAIAWICAERLKSR